MTEHTPKQIALAERIAWIVVPRSSPDWQVAFDAALAAIVEVSDPRLIETAPKDGHFLGWNEDDEIWEVWAAKTFHGAREAWPLLKSTGNGDPHQLILGVQASAVSAWLPLPDRPVKP